jgi:hypothetical protein
MIMSDSRGTRLHALDARLIELVADRRAAPRGIDEDGGALCELAVAIADSMAAWNEIMPRVRLAPSSRFEPIIAGGLAIESVFDALLDASSLSVLIAAFELAATPL